MILYENTVSNFIESAKNKKLIDYFSEEYYERFSRRITQTEKNQWKYTIKEIKDFLLEAEISSEVGLRIDYVVTSVYKWFEVILAGCIQHENRVHITEFLPFEKVVSEEPNDVYLFDVNEDTVLFVHPSLQSISYKEFIGKNIDVISGGARVTIDSSVFLFECGDEESLDKLNLKDSFVKEAQIFTLNTQESLFDSLGWFRNADCGKDVLMILHSKDQLCSAGLETYLSGLLSEDDNRKLYPEQRCIAADVLSSVNKSDKGLYILNGMAGTGKTAVAIFILKVLVSEGRKVLFLFGNKMLLEQASNMMSQKNEDQCRMMMLYDFLQKKEEDYYDVIIVDEYDIIGLSQEAA